jgi:hypothetical protein
LVVTGGDATEILRSLCHDAWEIARGGVGLRAVLRARAGRVVYGDADEEDPAEVRYREQQENRDGDEERELDCALTFFRTPTFLLFVLYSLEPYPIHRAWLS